MNNKYLKLSFLLMIIPFSVLAEEYLDLQKLIKKGKVVNTMVYPDADIVLVDDYDQVEYQKDGSYVNINDACVKILTEAGRRGSMTTSMGYDLDYGTAMFVRVDIIKADGKIVNVDIAENSKTMINPSQMGSNIYNPDMKVVTLSIPGLEIGDMVRTINKDVCTKARMPNTFSDFSDLEFTVPYLGGTFTYIGPKDMPLVHKVVRSQIPGSFTNTVEYSDDKVIYKWHINEIAQVFPEPSMPSLSTVGQRLQVSTVADWETVSKWYDDLCQEPLSATNAAMVAKVAELTKDCKTDMEKVKAIFYFVSQKVRYMGLTTEDTAPGYEPHAVSNTFEKLYGVCRDKAALLVAMERIAGFKSYPVLILSGPKKDQEIPDASFNHAITCVELVAGDYILMDPTDETTKDILPAYLTDCSYLVAKPEGDILRKTAIIPAEENMLFLDTNATIDKDGTLIAEVLMNFEGANDNGLRGAFTSMKEDQCQKAFEGMVKGSINGGELISYEVLPKDMTDMTTNISIRLRYTAKDVPITNGKLLTLPGISIGSNLGVIGSTIGATGLETRKYPYVTGMACGVKSKLKIKMKGLVQEAISLPATTNFANDFIYLKSKDYFTNDTFFSESEFKILTLELSTNQYLELKDILKVLSYDGRKKVFFKNVAKSADDKLASLKKEVGEIYKKTSSDPYADANIRTILLDYKARIIAQDEYETETFVRKKVLTYAGKKGASELSFSYNPIRDKFELLEARVINPNGEVKEISDEEINIMDSSWVSSAPRYPGSKKLVANLPDVDVGSIIEYKYRYHRKDRQFYSDATCFRSSEPKDMFKERIEVPSHLKLKIRDYQGGKVDYIHTVEGTTNVYSWAEVCTNIVKPEASAPPSCYYLPGFYASTGKWKGLADLISASLEPVVAGQSNCVAKALELTKNCSNDTERIIAIRDFIETNIRVAGPGFLSLPLNCLSDGDTVLKEGYGHSADFAILYYCMLKGIGLKTEFLLSSGDFKVEGLEDTNLEVPQNGNFNFLMIRVKDKGAWIYLNDTDQYSQLGTTGRYKYLALSLTKPNFFKKWLMLQDDIGDIFSLKIAKEYKNKSRSSVNIKLSDDGTALYTSTNWVYGTAFSGFHQTFKEMTPEDRRRFELELVSSISQTAKATRKVVTDYSRYPGIVTIQVKIDKYAVVDGDSYYFNIPNSSGNTLGLTLNRRTYPLYWASNLDSESSLTIELPPSFDEVVMGPTPMVWKAPYGAGEIARISKVKDGKLVINSSTKLRPVIIPVDLYPSLLESNQKLSHPSQNLILLKK